MSVTFTPGTKVQYSGMVDPAEIISGPHSTTYGRNRYLIRKADGNVSLVFTGELTAVVSRVQKMADQLAREVYGCPFHALNPATKALVRTKAARLLIVADESRGK